MDIKPIKNKRTTEIILEQIKQFMIDGQLNPGDKLPTEMELADLFQVSRTSIRESLSALSLTGILEIRQGEGIFVKHSLSNAVIEPLTFILLMEKNNVQNILEVRKALEIVAVDLAAERRTEQDIESLRVLVEQMEKDLPEAKNSEHLDLEFHLALATASKNPLLDRLMNTVQEIFGQTLKVTRTLWMMSSQEGTTQQLFEEHKAMYVAVANGENGEARRLMYEHLTKVEQQLQRYKELTDLIETT
ncbi:MAG: GntR family transcriptional regulator [Gracilibacter sp. BRH_c7a]|nr:MAG: GntR family transcriptional regulator [Gracilibacter sp. BRH_c7a]